ncbi:MAG: hypothetical protein GY832_24290 [Chloroflexi bacterium]|nr:hypothetical protein [Chloroflexota bacterium]
MTTRQRINNAIAAMETARLELRTCFSTALPLEWIIVDDLHKRTATLCCELKSLWDTMKSSPMPELDMESDDACLGYVEEAQAAERGNAWGAAEKLWLRAVQTCRDDAELPKYIRRSTICDTNAHKGK